MHIPAYLQQVQQQVTQHPLYTTIETIEQLRIFMSHHVFAVWDFMSLLKRLQQHVTTVTIPWTPYAHGHFTRFIHEIVLAEESDHDGQGGYASHYALYLQAMTQCGAHTATIEKFVSLVQAGVCVEQAWQHVHVPISVRNFVTHTLDIAQQGKPHEVAAAFLYGREDLIPEMFQTFVDRLRQQGMAYPKLTYYLQRHIELDGDQHGPLAKRLLEALCGDDAQKWEEAYAVATQSLQQRVQLWDGVLKAVTS